MPMQLALFDFDHTLTTCDTYSRFLRTVATPGQLARAVDGRPLAAGLSRGAGHGRRDPCPRLAGSVRRARCGRNRGPGRPIRTRTAAGAAAAGHGPTARMASRAGAPDGGGVRLARPVPAALVRTARAGPDVQPAAVGRRAADRALRRWRHRPAQGARDRTALRAGRLRTH